MVELKVLQAVRLKGELNRADLAATVDEDPATVARTTAELTEAGLLLDVGRNLKLSPDGRSRLELLLEKERSGIDRASMATAYEEFLSANAEFKIVVSDWTLKRGEPNAYDDSGYDAALLTRLDQVHARVLTVISTAEKHFHCGEADSAAAGVRRQAGGGAAQDQRR